MFLETHIDIVKSSEAENRKF